MSRKIIEHLTESTNHDSGEVVTIKKSISVTTKTTDEFFMIFVKYLSGFFELTSAVDIKVLIKFCQCADFNTGQVLLPAGKRKELCDELNLKSTHLSNSITRLKAKGLVIGEQGTYELNPIVAWKGDMKTREQLIKQKNMRLDFRIDFNSTKFD
jgi:hypothetical protein